MTPTQMGLYNLMQNDGHDRALVRVKGGYWVLEGTWPADSETPPPGRDANPPVPWFGTSTVYAMERAGVLKNVGLDQWKWPVYKLDREGLRAKGFKG